MEHPEVHMKIHIMCTLLALGSHPLLFVCDIQNWYSHVVTGPSTAPCSMYWKESSPCSYQNVLMMEQQIHCYMVSCFKEQS